MNVLKKSLNASFIIPVNNDSLVDRLKNNLGGLFTDYEIIPIYGANSFFDSWRKGLKKASKKYLVLAHQDVEFLSFPDLEKIFVDKVGLVGAAGSRIITRDSPPWYADYWKRRITGKLSGWVYQRIVKLITYKNYLGKYGEVVILDGVCLVTTKKILEKVGIPNINWADWDFYDHVLSLDYLKCGYKLLTVPIILIHDSLGIRRRKEFKRDKEMFVKTYFDKVDKYVV